MLELLPLDFHVQLVILCTGIVSVEQLIED